MPRETISYFRGERIKITVMELGVQEITEKNDKVNIKFVENGFENEESTQNKNEINIEKIIELMGQGKGKYIKSENSFLYNGTIEKFITEYK